MASAAFVVVLLLAAAWIKPWDRNPPLPIAAVPSSPSSAAGSVAPPDPTMAAPTPAPTPDPATLAARRATCRQARIWRLVSVEESARWRTRTMWGVAVQEATGPADPQLDAALDKADRLTAIGVCAPVTPVLSAVDQLLQVVLWHVSADGTVREVTRPVIVDEPLFELGEAYYAPPQDEGETWAAGRYVFEIRRLAGGASRWLALDYVPTGPAEARLE
jgi:hypothetical protein